MKQRKPKYLHFIISLVLVLCMVTGCAAPGGKGRDSMDPAGGKSATNQAGGKSPTDQAGGKSATDPSDQSAGSTPSYEKYTKADLDAQAGFDKFLDDLFLDEVKESPITLHYTLADPAAYGITDYDKTLGTVTLAESKQALADAKSLKVQLNNIDPRRLREDQLLTYTILSSHVNTLLSSEGLELYDQPLSSSLGIQSQLPILLSEYVFYNKQDVEDYLTLLSSIDPYYESIVEFEKQKTEAGLGLCDTALDRIIQSCNAYLLDADHSFMAETFSQRLDQVEGLTDKEKEDYNARNRAAINDHFVPAYKKLIDGLTPLKGTKANDKGLYYLPQGKQYYEYLVNTYTGTSYKDIPQLKKAISDQMMGDLADMDGLLTQNPALAKKMYTYSFSLKDPNEILENLRTQCTKDFPAIDDYVCNIKNVPSALESTLSPAFYLTVPIDRPQDNSIYINNGSTNTSRNLYTTLAHEGYPGHMYQTLYFNSKNHCNLRKLLNFGGYSEGWATYVEYYAYTLDNGLDPGLGELLMHNAAFTLSLYAILDINIHYEGWDVKQVQDYLNHYFRISDPSVITTIYYDIVENPANYLEYYVGYLEILNMQKEARKILGPKYSNMEFNRFLLDMGPAPFSVIKPYFNEWVVKENGG